MRRLDLVLVFAQSLHDLKALKNVDEVVDTPPLDPKLLNAFLYVDQIWLREVSFATIEFKELPAVVAKAFGLATSSLWVLHLLLFNLRHFFVL